MTPAFLLQVVVFSMFIAIAVCISPSFPQSFVMQMSQGGDFPMNVTVAWDAVNNRATYMNSIVGAGSDSLSFIFSEKGMEYEVKNSSSRHSTTCCHMAIHVGMLGSFWNASLQTSNTTCGGLSGLSCWAGPSNDYFGSYNEVWCFNKQHQPTCWLLSHMPGIVVTSLVVGAPSPSYFQLPTSVGMCPKGCTNETITLADKFQMEMLLE